MKKGITKLERILISLFLLAFMTFALTFVRDVATQAGHDAARRWLS